MDDDTPRSYTSPRDDRFYTPRTIARSNSASNSDEWQTPRFGTEGEFQTPRTYYDTDRKDSARSGLPLSQRSNSSREYGYADNISYAAQAKQFYANSYDGYYQSHNNDSQPKQPATSSRTYVAQSENYSGAKVQYGNQGQEQYADQQDQPPSHISEQDVEDIFSYTRHGRVEEIEKLLNKGIPIDIRDPFGNTLLIIACQNGNKRVAKAILRRGANINARNLKGNTPLHYCYHCKWRLCSDLLCECFNLVLCAHVDGYGDTLGQYIISKVKDTYCRTRCILTFLLL
jgi:hypothetical protein